ncbi:MAG TPA: response regulator [Armatimonadota bacterium]|jgi:DNA-binding response OmpR family regulator
MSNGKRVLIIDDDVDFLTVNSLALESAGFVVDTADSPAAGVEKALANRPDLILQDLMMEELHSGFAVISTLGNHPETRDIPVIMISAVTTDTGFRIDGGGEVPEWLKVADFINKPVEPQVLVERVKAVLGNEG